MSGSYLKKWLYSAAQEKLRAEAIKAAQANLQPGQASEGRTYPPPEKTCLAGIVFALGAESGGLEDLLDQHVVTRAAGLVVHEGLLDEQPLALIISGPGGPNAARAVQALLAGHRPQWIVSAGFAGALKPELKRYQIVLADQVISPSGEKLAVVEPKTIDKQLFAEHVGVRIGPVLSMDRLVREPEQKLALGKRVGAVAVDMESFPVVREARRADVGVLVVRAITDTADEALPAEVETLLKQPSSAGRWGAALGAIWRRPGSIKDLFRLKETALVASDRLAAFLKELMGHLAEMANDDGPGRLESQ